MASARAQVTAALRNAFIRPGPDETYADGDDASWLDVDWAALQHPMELPGGTVNVLDTGDASDDDQPPLLFVHGWSSNWQSWLLTIPYFMRKRRCIAFDLPGFGYSDMPEESISINGYAATADALCAELGVERVSVIGNSMGGFIGAELALAFPTRVDRLVLVSAAGLSIEEQPREPLEVVARMIAAGIPYASRYEQTIVRRPGLRRAALQLVIRYPEKLSVPLAQELVSGSGKPGFLPALSALLGYSFRERLREIEIPVLVVWGRNDLLVPVSDADEYVRLIGPNARREIFEDTGHAPMIERPSRFNALVDEFLKGAPAPERGIEGVSA